MSRPQRRRRRDSSKGNGRCGTPGCPENKAPGHYLCFEHLDPVVQVKEKIKRESEERSPFRRRSDNPDRITSEKQKIKSKAPRKPTCCWFGCLEPRRPGKNYCEFHLEQEEETE